MLNILGGSVHTVKKNTQALAVASKETGLEVNADKTKYMAHVRDQNKLIIRRFIIVPLRGWKSASI
jgi:hypothetical protein